MAIGGKRTTRRKSAHKTSRSRKVHATSIPQLKRSFDELEKGTYALLKTKGAVSSKVSAFQKLWKSIFHRPVSAEAAEAYLRVKQRDRSKKTRKHRGGAAPLAGAPLDYMLRPGVEGSQGSFPQQVSQGLNFYNTINQDALSKDCGTRDITPQVPVSIGSNAVKGGAYSIYDLTSTLVDRPFGSGIPPSPLQDLQTAMQGRPLPPSPDPIRDSV